MGSLTRAFVVDVGQESRGLCCGGFGEDIGPFTHTHSLASLIGLLGDKMENEMSYFRFPSG